MRIKRENIAFVREKQRENRYNKNQSFTKNDKLITCDK